MLTSSYTITTKCNGRLNAAHAMIDDDRYDIVGCGAAGQPALDLLDQLWYDAIASAVRELSAFWALKCFFTIATKYNEPLARFQSRK